MRFSFVIPTYNNRKLLGNTLAVLNSLEGYGRNDFEVIIVDDGSTDGTGEFVGRLPVNYPLHYRYLKRDENSCRARARNHGWKNASGEIIIFIDSDILVRRNYLKEIDRCFNLDNNILVVGMRIHLSEKDTHKIISGESSPDNFYWDKDDFESLDNRYYYCGKDSYNANANMFPWTLVYSCNMVVMKKHLEKVNGFDEKFIAWGLEDNELGLALEQTGVHVVINSRIEVLHQYHGNRNDHFIPEEKKAGYNANVEYLLAKHNLSLKIDRRFLKQVLNGEMGFFSFPSKYEIYTVDFKVPDNLQNVQEAIQIYLEKGKSMVIVNDYNEKTDIDLWIQLLGKQGAAVRYFPVSKQIDLSRMKAYMDSKKMEGSPGG